MIKSDQKTKLHTKLFELIGESEVILDDKNVDKILQHYEESN